MLKPRKQTESVTPYSRLARIYDYVMRHVDYVHWADYVETVFQHHDLGPARLMDLACGTGSLAIEFRKRAYHVTGADVSEEMLAVARDKARAVGYDIAFHHCDFMHLEGLPQFEAVLCLYDSMNYLMTIEDVSAALAGIHKIVQPGGTFVFDVCTESNSLRYFRDMTDRDQGDGFSYIRRSTFEDGVQHNRFEIRFDDADQVFHEEHRQRIYPLEAIWQEVEGSPFSCLGAYDGFELTRPNDRSDRVHFVLQA